MPRMIAQPTGAAGIRLTVATMINLVNANYLAPIIRDQAVMATRHCPRGDQRCQCASLLAWVRRKVHYVPDPTDVEALHHPVLIAEAIRKNRMVYGDCDDFSIYLAALMKAIGLRPRFRAVGYNGRFYQHVYVQCGEMKLDGTMDDWLAPYGSWRFKPPMHETSEIDEVV